MIYMEELRLLFSMRVVMMSACAKQIRPTVVVMFEDNRVVRQHRIQASGMREPILGVFWNARAARTRGGRFGEGDRPHEEEPDDHRQGCPQGEQKKKLGRIPWICDVRNRGKQKRRESEPREHEPRRGRPHLVWKRFGRCVDAARQTPIAPCTGQERTDNQDGKREVG